MEDRELGINLIIDGTSYQLPLNSKQENFTGEDGYIKVRMCYRL